jgi:hypothetical protein
MFRDGIDRDRSAHGLRLAVVPLNLRLLGLQPAGADHPGQCHRFEDGVDIGDRPGRRPRVTVAGFGRRAYLCTCARSYPPLRCNVQNPRARIGLGSLAAPYSYPLPQFYRL